MADIPHPWQTAPTELIAFAIDNLDKEDDINHLAGFLVLDIGVETLFKTFLNLPDAITKTEIPWVERKKAAEGRFPELCEGIQRAAKTRLEGVDFKHVLFYHGLRNQLYHDGQGSTIPRKTARDYAKLAVDLLNRLLEVDLSKELVSTAPKTKTITKPKPTSSGILYKEFFEDLFKQFKLARPGSMNASKAGPSSSTWFSAGRAGFLLGWSFRRGEVLSVDFFFDTGDKERNKQAFDKMYLQKTEIEKEIGVPLLWERLDFNKQSRVRSEITAQITDPPHKLNKAKAWAIDTGSKFYDAFHPRIKKL